MKRSLLLGLAFITAFVLSGCSIKKMAANSLGDGLAGGGGTFASDNDPELIREALPFSLKMMETLLDIVPENKNLLLGACKGFTQYGYAFVEMDARKIEATDYKVSVEQKKRAVNLYLRAQGYGLRALEVAHKGTEKAARKGGDDLKQALTKMKKKDVETLYWTGMSWMAAVSLGKEDPALMAELSSAEALIMKAFELEPDFDNGSIHGFLISFMGGRPEAMGGSQKKAREHFEKVIELTQGLSAGPYVSVAEAISVQNQDKKEFEAMLKKAIAIDVNIKPEWRLQNLIYQNRAKWLLTQEKELFAD